MLGDLNNSFQSQIALQPGRKLDQKITMNAIAIKTNKDNKISWNGSFCSKNEASRVHKDEI